MNTALSISMMVAFVALFVYSTVNVAAKQKRRKAERQRKQERQEYEHFCAH
jgi:hypothetical protein